MTDINASLKKTIDGEPGPQHKEKGKAEFNFIEGEDGVPYSYDKKVESRLTAIEDKLDSVIENGSVNTQLTGSNVEDGLPVREMGVNAKELLLDISRPDFNIGDTHYVLDMVNVEEYSKLALMFRTTEARVNVRMKSWSGTGSRTVPIEEFTQEDAYQFFSIFDVVDDFMSLSITSLEGSRADTDLRYIKVVGIK